MVQGQSGSGLVLAVVVGLVLLPLVAALWYRRWRHARTTARPAIIGPRIGWQLSGVQAEPPADAPAPPPDPPVTVAPEPIPTPVDMASPAHAVEPPMISEPDDLVVRLFGTPAVEGWTQPPQRWDAVELCAYLATHQDRPLRAEEIVVALGGGDLYGSDRAPKTLMNALSALRRSVGAHRLPDATTRRRLPPAARGDRLGHLPGPGDRRRRRRAQR